MSSKKRQAREQAAQQLLKEQELAKLRAKEWQRQAAREAYQKKAAERREREAARRAAMTPTERAGEDRRNLRILLGVGATVIVLIGGLIAFAVLTKKPEKPAPDVVGQELDLAESNVRAAGLSYKESSGDVFDVVVKANWTVCSQDPEPGVATITVTLHVGRACAGGHAVGVTSGTTPVTPYVAFTSLTSAMKSDSCGSGGLPLCNLLIGATFNPSSGAVYVSMSADYTDPINGSDGAVAACNIAVEAAYSLGVGSDITSVSVHVAGRVAASRSSSSACTASS